MSDRRFYICRTPRAVLALAGTFSLLPAFLLPAFADDSSGAHSFLDPTGVTTTINVSGTPFGQGPFFQSLGTNGRSCSTCHVASQAMSISVPEVQARFALTRGNDPLFASVDGADCPTGRPGVASDHSLLLTHGLIRVALPMPANAQFTISVVHDPYGCAILPNPAGGSFISVYRRPLPTANLGFLSTIMFDGRETAMPLNNILTDSNNLATDLTQQALHAVQTHAQSTTDPSADQLAAIVDFEEGLFSAQSLDFFAGPLAAGAALGGPAYLQSLQPLYYPGQNDALGADPHGEPFNPANMTLYTAWTGIQNNNGNIFEWLQDAARRSIAAGEVVFNTIPINITNVRGLNDNAALGKPATIVGHCATCHDTPNVGNHSLALPLDIGTSHTANPGLETDPQILAGVSQLSPADVPIYQISGCPSDPFSTSPGPSFFTSDPGKALITGSCSDFNRGKGPILRGIAARAPYFHNGAAANLRELVEFYNQRFQINLTDRQKADLIAFLNSL